MLPARRRTLVGACTADMITLATLACRLPTAGRGFSKERVKVTPLARASTLYGAMTAVRNGTTRTLCVFAW